MILLFLILIMFNFNFYQQNNLQLQKAFIAQMISQNNWPKKQTIYSAIGAAISMSLTNPFNLVRFRMQTMPDLLLQNQLKTAYKGPIDCLKRVYYEQGFMAFWKGNGSNIIRFYPAEVLTFMLKDILNKKLFENLNITTSECTHISLISGIVSGCITLTLLYPLQYARLKIINDVRGDKLNIYKLLKETFKSDGIQGIFRGSLMSYLGMGIFRGLYFARTKNYYQRFLVSYFSTLAALLGIYPFDTIRRRLMMTSGQKYKYGSYAKFIKSVFAKQGIKGFFPGVTVIIFQAFTIGIMFALFDNIFCTQNRNLKFINLRTDAIEK